MKRIDHTGYLPPTLLSLAAGALYLLINPLAATAVIYVMLVLALALTRPFFAAGVFLAVLYLRPGDFIPALQPLRPALLPAALCLGAWLLWKGFSGEVRWPRGGQNRLMAAFTLLILLSLVFSSHPEASRTAFLESFSKVLLIYVVLSTMVDRPGRMKSFFLLIVVLVSVLAVLTLTYGRLEDHLVEGSRTALIGLLGDPNDLAVVLFLPVPFLFHTVLGRGSKGARLTALAPLLLIAAAALSTKSRGALLGLGVMGFLILREHIRSKALLAAAMVLVIGAVFVAGGLEERGIENSSGRFEASVQGRIDAWRAAFMMTKAKPIAGVGFETFPLNYPSYASGAVDWRPKAVHNSWLKVLAELGLPAFFIFMSLIWLTLRDARRIGLQKTGDALADHALRGLYPAFAGYCVSATFLSLSYSWFLYIQIAVIFAVRQWALSGCEEESSTCDAARRRLAAPSVG